jgi:hypothetical protein
MPGCEQVYMSWKKSAKLPIKTSIRGLDKQEKITKQWSILYLWLLKLRHTHCNHIAMDRNTKSVLKYTLVYPNALKCTYHLVNNFK